MPKKTYSQAINEALRQEMRRDPNVIILGEDVAAWVVLRRDAVVGVEELQTFCRERLSDYKVPRTLRLVDALPRNATGKVVKSELRL